MSIGYEGLGDYLNAVPCDYIAEPNSTSQLYVAVLKPSSTSSISVSNTVKYFESEVLLKHWIMSNPVLANNSRIFKADEVKVSVTVTLENK